MQINIRDLSPGERIQLAGVLLQAWTAFQQQSHHQQSSQCALSLPELAENVCVMCIPGHTAAAQRLMLRSSHSGVS